MFSYYQKDTRTENERSLQDERREFKTTAQQIRDDELDGYLDW